MTMLRRALLAVVLVAALSLLGRAHENHTCLTNWDSSVDYFDNEDIIMGFPEGTEVSSVVVLW